MKVNRYITDNYDMDDDGDFVFYSDYKTLKDRLDELLVLLDNAGIDVWEQCTETTEEDGK